MRVDTRDDWMVFSGVRPFSLERTLFSGQTFRWTRKNGVFEGVVGNCFVQAKQKGEDLWARTFPEALNRGLIEDYFSLGFALEDAMAKLSQDERIAEASRRHPGIRILRQEPWECLASFILAINKSIPQIEKTVSSLCTMLGQKIRVGEKAFSIFPSAAALADAPERVLRSTKMGFRAKYLKRAAQKIVQDQIDLVQYRKRPYSEAKEALMKFYGIGPKVADCICLFSLDHLEAFPVDVWIGRAMQRYYGGAKRLALPRMQEIARERFGPHAGIAQQYLYHAIRSDGRPGR